MTLSTASSLQIVRRVGVNRLHFALFIHTMSPFFSQCDVLVTLPALDGVTRDRAGRGRVRPCSRPHVSRDVNYFDKRSAQPAHTNTLDTLALVTSVLQL